MVQATLSVSDVCSAVSVTAMNQAGAGVACQQNEEVCIHQQKVELINQPSISQAATKQPIKDFSVPPEGESPTTTVFIKRSV